MASSSLSVISLEKNFILAYSQYLCNKYVCNKLSMMHIHYKSLESSLIQYNMTEVSVFCFCMNNNCIFSRQLKLSTNSPRGFVCITFAYLMHFFNVLQKLISVCMCTFVHTRSLGTHFKTGYVFKKYAKYLRKRSRNAVLPRWA